ncbi:hypothetical protein BJY04DRAFT_71921 [Aspergillus karnatakaensis]|uniref:uncharacterized protein n=1 Tax=Aspergillus karnatakaensis TaxID=1810916 RepID=UPI003CCCAFE0
MLRQLLSVSALCLSLVSAEAFDGFPVPALSVVPQPYTLNLSTAECAFSYSDCSNSLPNSFLEISLSTKHDTLLANNDPVFPPPIPMNFNAKRSWASAPDNVPIAYSLDIEPLSHHASAVIGDLYRLKLTLVDLQGRPATDSPVTIGLVRRAGGDLEIIDLEQSEIPRYHHEILRKLEGKNRSWWRMETWKSYYVTYLNEETKTKTCDDTIQLTDGSIDVRVVSKCRDHQQLEDWTHCRHFMRHVRKALIPGLLGLSACIVACLVGFVVGKVIVEVYYYFYERRAPADVEGGDEKAVLSEKQLLMEHYAHPADTPPYSL